MMYLEKTINSLGRFISLMIPVIVILMIVIIVARYFLGIGLTGIQELVMYIHALIFLGCAGYVQYKDEHVRVDIFYRSSSSLYKKIINYFLSLFFLIPVCFVIGFYSIELIEMSWKIKEVSTEPEFNKNLLRKVDELELSVRSMNCLKNDNIIYIGDLVQKSEGEMLRTPNFGRKSLNEIKEILNGMSLYLGMEIPNWPPDNIPELSKKLEESI